MGCSPWGHKESDTSGQLSIHTYNIIPKERVMNFPKAWGCDNSNTQIWWFSDDPGNGFEQSSI